VATARTTHLIEGHASLPAAATAGFQRALLLGGAFLLVAAVVGLRVSQAHGEEHLDEQPDVLAVTA
ncbi:MAG: hypothetical protein QOG99_2940, partial [Frankiales bacterium]|nr:hypothetical protein [Frankiales bacterium]